MPPVEKYYRAERTSHRHNSSIISRSSSSSSSTSTPTSSSVVKEGNEKTLMETIERMPMESSHGHLQRQVKIMSRDDDSFGYGQELTIAKEPDQQQEPEEQELSSDSSACDPVERSNHPLHNQNVNGVQHEHHPNHHHDAAMASSMSSIPATTITTSTPLTNDSTNRPMIAGINAESILTEARESTTRRRRKNKRQIGNGDERTRHILQQARNASTGRDVVHVRSTREVLKMAGKVIPGADTLNLSSQSTEDTEDSKKDSRSQDEENDDTTNVNVVDKFSGKDTVRFSTETGEVVLSGHQSPRRCLSPTVSDVGSIDDFEKAVQGLTTKFTDESISRETILKKIDGIDSPMTLPSQPIETNYADDQQCGQELLTMFSTFCLGNIIADENVDKTNADGSDGKRGRQDASSRDVERPVLTSMEPTVPTHMNGTTPGRSKGTNTNHHQPNNIYTSPSIVSYPSIARIGSGPPPFTEAVNTTDADPRMPAWVTSQGMTTAAEKEESATAANKSNGKNGVDNETEESFYSLGTSRTVIVHEIVRGNWTWCTSWSPDGSRLAVATENHHLAVVEAGDSTVWRVRHDRRISDPVKNDSTHTVRSIAWGSQFIAIGGTGTAVSILSPIEPYPILHTIKDTGFVGSLHWKPNSAILAIGSREDRCIVVKVSAADEQTQTGPTGIARRIVSEILHTVHRRGWVNAVAFSPGGSVLAVGDGSGRLTTYAFQTEINEAPKIDNITDVMVDDSILDIEWAPDGQWLYVGGEDFAITVVDTSDWQVKRKISRDRWVQFISASNRGTHLAVGGLSSEVTLLDVNADWKAAMKVELKGLVPLSARWHPRDQYLALTGQDNSIVVIETTDARLIDGHYLKSASPIEKVEFSPDGDMVAVGNNVGIVTFYKSSGRSFVTTYELVLTDGAAQSINWSPNGSYIVIGSGSILMVVTKTTPINRNAKFPPKTSGFGVRKVIRDMERVTSISIHSNSRFVAVSGSSTRILDAGIDFKCVKRWDQREVLANAFSSDGTWLATVGRNQNVTIFDTSDSTNATEWKKAFTVQADHACYTVAWGPSVTEGLQYMAYGGEDKRVTIIEIRTYEQTWETVLEVDRGGVIHGLDWSKNGLLAVAIADGTVSIIDLGYLRSGWAVNEMDYKWQRQGVTCFTEIRRNQGRNVMRAVRWIPGIVGEENLLAVGGSDGALEVIDLTERNRCKGFGPPPST